MPGEVAAALREEAISVDERRLLVLAGDREAGLQAAADALDDARVPPDETALVSDATDGRVLPTHLAAAEHLPVVRADRLLGTTRTAVVLDCHDALQPNALGTVVGAVDGGGLLVLLTPPLDEWPETRDGFDESLAVPPFALEDVAGRFRRRLVETLRAHPGIAIVDVDADAVERDGLTRPAPRRPPDPPTPPPDRRFPEAAYDACLTGDQVDALAAFEHLRDPDQALVVEADRGRGKSSAAGLAAACLADVGLDVLVTAPTYRSAEAAFVRAEGVLRDLDSIDSVASVDGEPHQPLETIEGGVVRFAHPPDAAALPGNPDAVVVDEAAALPVRLLERFLDCDRVAFVTTVHGYEGAGRGFDVRFRDRLDGSDHAVTEVMLREPIRYAPGDPVEVWAFRALLLDARPAVDPLVVDADSESVAFERVDRDELVADEHLLREAFGLLVAAHYRTEPADLARLLDAPNVSTRALTCDGHVVSVALFAREGNLPEDLRAHMYEGGRVRGNMLPDVFTSQLGDENAAVPVGLRVMRIATHHAVRSRGLGSRLLAESREEFAAEVDWLGVGYGATPELCSFWQRNGYATVHVSTTRNRSSGEHSALMLDPTSEVGEALRDRHGGWFAGRVRGQFPDALRDLDPDVARAVLRAAAEPPEPSLSAGDWPLVARMAFGPGLYSVDPEPFRGLAMRALVDGDRLSPRLERLLVLKVLQGRAWTPVADSLGFHSRRECMRALGEAYRSLVDAYGTEAAHREKRRFSSQSTDSSGR